MSRVMDRVRRIAELSPPRLPRLELHVTHACNLTCESCSHYSNQNHGGHVSLADAEAWMARWSRRVAPEQLHLLGGEPTLHPELTGFVRAARRHWPRTRISIRTNGFFLHRHEELPAALAADGNADVVISLHHDSSEYRARLAPVLALAERWESDLGVPIRFLRSFEGWTQRYRGTGDAMTPFEDGAPRASWSICPARECKQLFDGQLWKCGPLAYLPLQKAKYALSPKWDFYLGYRPLAPDCTERELRDFLGREDEPFCGMCSAVRRPMALPIPLRRKGA